MKFTAEQIAGILEGDVDGDPNIEVSKLAKIEVFAYVYIQIFFINLQMCTWKISKTD